jgi:hypothetical protein
MRVHRRYHWHRRRAERSYISEFFKCEMNEMPGKIKNKTVSKNITELNTNICYLYKYSFFIVIFRFRAQPSSICLLLKYHLQYSNIYYKHF